MNFRRILSKSSLRSSSSSGKSLSPSEEVLRLQSEIELLKQTIESFKISVESRDAAIGTLAREKEKLYVELKSVQRTNRNIHQQLVDERDMYSKEKEYLVEEIKRLSKNNNKEYNLYQPKPDDVQSNLSLKDEIKAKDEVIYNICAKYLKMKSSKQLLQKKMEKLQNHSQKICENVVLLLHENRQTLDNLLNRLLNASTVTPSSKNYLKLLKMNANLHYENTQLKICLSLKDFYSELDEESAADNSQNKSSTAKLSKSEGKMDTATSKHKKKNLHRYHAFRQKIYRMPKFEDFRKFRSIHEALSPHFRRKKYYSSDPCLARS
ncbi:uncharacterized protein LOC126377158 [Pectinophora gossypiella]|uniref:uncharacterized protein LOC126377158 n=1 Tax=Pectinophora gossypiella TaxID=13191 RepID=UPI00214E272C|nr:uncharacterized protein LOC126377158 [Pectinophora gossypiella]